MEHKAVSAITRNSMYFFSYARKFSTISTALGPLIDMDNKVISCPQNNITLSLAFLRRNHHLRVYSNVDHTCKMDATLVILSSVWKTSKKPLVISRQLLQPVQIAFQQFYLSNARVSLRSPSSSYGVHLWIQVLFPISQNDSELLQKDLCAVYNWTCDNNMELNASKLKCLRYGPNSDLQQFPYKSNTGCTIEERGHLKDLGVTMCRDGTFKKHIQTTVKTAQNQCSWILRTFMTREVIPMLTLWKSLVQCKLDYCSQLWSPERKGDIQAIEMVQNSFLRKVPGIRHMSYWQKLKQLKLYSQERRRERYTIIYIWRMLEGQVPCINSLDGGANVKSIWHIKRGRECQIPCINHHSPRNIQALKHATLPVRGQQLFNTLPRDIRNMTGCKVDMFKRRLDKYLSTIPDEPQVLGYTTQWRADSNSVLQMAKFVNAHWPSQVEVFGAGDSPSRRGCAYSIAGAQWCPKILQGNKVRWLHGGHGIGAVNEEEIKLLDMQRHISSEDTGQTQSSRREQTTL